MKHVSEKLIRESARFKLEIFLDLQKYILKYLQNTQMKACACFILFYSHFYFVFHYFDR